MLADVKDYKALKKSIVRMYKKWVNVSEPSGKRKGKDLSGDSDLHKDFSKQREYLEESLNNVTGKLTKSYQTFEQSNKKIMNENVTLLQEYNNLKIELHELSLKLKVNDNDVSKQRKQEILMLRGENMKLSEDIANLEQRDAEINA